MTPLDRALLVATANSYVGLAGEVAASAVADAGAWDTDFVHHTGFWSHFDFEREASNWPVPNTRDLFAIAAWAHGNGLARETAEAGYLFLLRSPVEERYLRVGIVAHVSEVVELQPGKYGFHCVTIEGDSSAELQLGGGRVMRHERPLSAWHGDLFIDWAAFGPRLLA
jgi:hypothetical protein